MTISDNSNDNNNKDHIRVQGLGVTIRDEKDYKSVLLYYMVGRSPSLNPSKLNPTPMHSSNSPPEAVPCKQLLEFFQGVLARYCRGYTGFQRLIQTNLESGVL